MLFQRRLKKGIVKALKDKGKLKKSHLKNASFQITKSCSLKQKYVEEDLKQTNEKLELRKQKKKKITNIILLVVNVLIVGGVLLYYGLTSGIKSFSELINDNVAYKYLLIALGLFVFALIIDSLKYFQLIKKTTGKCKPVTALNTHLIGRYYDSITPFAVGGQPFQIMYLMKKGVSGSKSTSIPLEKHFFSMIAFTIISIGVLISHFIHPITNSVLLITLAIISIVCNSAIVVFILLFSVSKRVMPALVIKILKFLNKMHIVKNYKVTFFKVAKFVKNYQRSMKDFSKSFWTIFIQLMLAFASYLAIYSFAYFIYLAFLPLGGTGGVSWADLFCSAVFCDLCAGIMPLPSGTGLAEISFDRVFKDLFSITVFPWAMLIWRFLMSYSFIAMGGIKVICSYIISLCKNRKKTKQKS